MSLNSRQKRARKRKLALAMLAHARNPPMVASKGAVRSVWSKTMPPRAHIPFHAGSQPRKSSSGRFGLDGYKAVFDSLPTVNSLGASDPASPRAPKDDEPTKKKPKQGAKP